MEWWQPCITRHESWILVRILTNHTRWLLHAHRSRPLAKSWSTQTEINLPDDKSDPTTHRLETYFLFKRHQLSTAYSYKTCIAWVLLNSTGYQFEITLMGKAMTRMNSYSCLQALLNTLHIEETLKSWQIIGKADTLGTVVVKMQLVPVVNDHGRGRRNGTCSLSGLRDGVNYIETTSNNGEMSYSDYSFATEGETDPEVSTSDLNTIEHTTESPTSPPTPEFDTNHSGSWNRWWGHCFLAL